ncbi:MAG: 16S rRNA (uracil(1498)-N(3))-methyltransferase [Thermoanaerobaculia bacterium]
MRHRIFVETITPEVDVSGDEFHHAVRVVRVREGEEIELFDGRGGAARGRVGNIGRDTLRVDVTERIPSRESRVRLHLAAAIIQLDKFDLVLQKATELGAASIIPLVTDRIELRPERYRGRSERWQKIVFEAVKQCGRASLPSVREPTRFDDVAATAGVRFVFDADEEPDRIPDSFDEITLMIGPEGGWSEREIAFARGSGCTFQRLGPRRLRAETAAISALSIVAARAGDI